MSEQSPVYSGAIFNQQEKVKILLLDLLLLFFAFGAVIWFRFRDFTSVAIPWGELALIFCCQLIATYIFGGYELSHQLSRKRRWLIGGLSFFATLLVVIVFNYLTAADKAGLYGRGVLVGSLAIFYLVSTGLRFFLHHRYSREIRSERWVVLTCQEYFRQLTKDFSKLNFVGAEIINCDEVSIRELEALMERRQQSVILAVDKKNFLLDIKGKSLAHRIMDLRFQGVRVLQLNQLYESLWRKVPSYFLSVEWFATQDGFVIVVHPIRQRLKRLFDILISLLLLVLTLPILLVVSVVVYLESPGPVIFRQRRTGKTGAVFTIYKLRSMVLNAEKPGEAKWASENDKRVLKIGSFMRKTRIDELPQLLNVLRGEMSFVGPRPERPEFVVELEQEIPFYNMRHLIQPGLTGWAQVMYPYGASVEDAREKLQYDLYYIKNHSLWLDLQILMRTVRVVFLGGGR